MPDQYLSTDPNAGEPVAPAGPKGVNVIPGAAMPTHVPDLSLLKPDNWPALGGTIGGVLGGAGGSAFGLGFGGVPGATAGAALGGAAGEAGKQLVSAAKGQPNTATGAAKDIALQGGIQGGIEAAGGALTKGAGMAAQNVYRGYLKPALNAVDLPKAREVVTTALREALPISKAGEDRASALISEINKQVQGLLAQATEKVDLHQIAEKVRAFAQAKYNRPGIDPSDFKAAMGVADNIDQHPSLGLPEGAKPTRIEVSASEANRVKTDVRPNSRAYGQQGAGPESVARKEAGHQLRTRLEEIQPAIGAMNNRERQIIDAVEAVTKAVGREGNRNAFFGVPTMLSAAVGTGYGAQNDPMSGLAAGVATRLALTPEVASRVAILASRFGKVPGAVPAVALRLAVQIALSEQEGNQTNQGHQPDR